jgi:hypothetical protein
VPLASGRLVRGTITGKNLWSDGKETGQEVASLNPMFGTDVAGVRRGDREVHTTAGGQLIGGRITSIFIVFIVIIVIIVIIGIMQMNETLEDVTNYFQDARPSDELVSNSTGALRDGRMASLVVVVKPTACLHLGHQVVGAREMHRGVEVRCHITKASTAILRSRAENPRFIVEGTARKRDRLVGSDIAGLQNSCEVVVLIIRSQSGGRVSRVANPTVVARILASVIMAEKALTYKRGAEKTGAATEAARIRRATLHACIVRGQ